MTITEQENVLFEEWRKNRGGFVTDGVVDEKSYINSNPRLMFVLKEVNDPEGGNWDLRQFLRGGGRQQTWDNITRWVEGIRKLSLDIKWSKLEKITKEQRIDALKSICVINLKKSPGGCTTGNTVLWGVANEDKKFINRQFALYNSPDIIICCGSVTKDIFDSIIDFDFKPKGNTTTRGIKYYEYVPSKFVISYAHPEARVKDCLLYYGLVDAIREIREIQFN